MAQADHDTLRAASKNERRYITRHSLGFYRALTMTGLYTLNRDYTDFDATIAEFWFPALKWCIDKHPILSAAIVGQDGEEPVFVRPKEGINLRRHVQIVQPDPGDGGDEIEALRRVLLTTHDKMFDGVDNVPPWKIVVVPMPNRTQNATTRAWIIFAYSHSVGDGRSGLVFHKTFLEGLQAAHRTRDHSANYKVPDPLSLPPSLEDACTLKISWAYLLFTLFWSYLPSFVRKRLDFQREVATDGTWTGEVMNYPDDPGEFRTGAAILVVPKERLNSALQICREKGGAKFTGLLNQLIVRALSNASALQDSRTLSVPIDNFVGQIVVDLRNLIKPYSDDMMVNCVSAIYETSPRTQQVIDLKSDPAFWDAVRNTTTRLAKSASTLVDQPIGLMKYLSNVRQWFLEKLGERRGSSYEISNVVVFDPSAETPKPVSGALEQDASEKAWDIERMVMSQPANATSCPLSFSVVTTKGGDMALTANWQLGVLGVEDEGEFVKDVLGRIEANLSEIGR
ncbi:alcohol acetyltransferase [Aspergillus filifer]